MCESCHPELPGAAHHAAEQPLLAAPRLLRARPRPAAPSQAQAGAGEVDLVIRHKPEHVADNYYSFLRLESHFIKSSFD